MLPPFAMLRFAPIARAFASRLEAPADIATIGTTGSDWRMSAIKGQAVPDRHLNVGNDENELREPFKPSKRIAIARH